MESEFGRFAGRLFRSEGILAVHGVDARMIVQGVAGLDRRPLERAFAACVATRPVSALKR